MDVLTSESLGALVKRPNLAGGKPNLVVVEPTKALEAYMKGELSRRIEASKAWKPSPGQMSNPDPIVSIITDGRFAAIDPRFFGAELEGESIITKMASNVVAKYHATKGNVHHDKEGNPAPIKGSTQIVFYNLGFGEQSQRSRGFNSRAAFTKLLTDGGIPATRSRGSTTPTRTPRKKRSSKTCGRQAEGVDRLREEDGYRRQRPESPDRLALSRPAVVPRRR